MYTALSCINCVVASSAKHLLVVEVVIVVELTLLVVVKEEIMAVRVVVMGVEVEVEVDVVVVVVRVVKTLNTASVILIYQCYRAEQAVEKGSKYLVFYGSTARQLWKCFVS